MWPLTLISTILRRFQSIDFGDLRVLNFACLVSISVVYTTLRVGTYAVSSDQVMAVDVLEAVDNQRNLVAQLSRQLLYAQMHKPITSPEVTGPITRAYTEIEATHRANLTAARGFLDTCRSGLCKRLNFPNPMQRTANEIAEEFADTGANPDGRRTLLQTLTVESLRYQQDLNEAHRQALALVRSFSRFNFGFELTTYFSMIALLIVQALYVFRPAIRRLNGSLAVRSDFLSRISHEIRNPMNSIIGMADILRSTKLNYEQRRYVDNLLRSGHALMDMLNNLIDFSVIEKGRLTLASAPFDLFSILDREINLIAISAHHKNLDFYVDIDPVTPNRLVGDFARLAQVLNSLLNNAVKFTERGHIRLSIDVVTDTPQGVLLRFAVYDTGIGVHNGQLGGIFDSFVQGDSSIQRKYGGSGLGLSIARKIVQQMGGSLQAGSELGKGSCFFFSVEIAKQSQASDQMLSPLHPLVGRHVVMLTAPGESSVYRQLFNHLGCKATTVESARELAALGSMDSYSDLLIDDSAGIIAMINARNSAGDSTLAENAVALIRSNFTKENMDLLKRNGFTRFLIKPLKPWELAGLGRTSAEPQESEQQANVVKTLKERLRELNPRILLVDDSNDNLFLLKELIAPIASTIHFAENGLEATDKFEANSYDVVLMDIQMPVMDGYTAIRKMRAKLGTSQIPIFAVTAHSGLVDAQKCRDAGFTDRIVKPVVRNDLFQSLAQALGLSTEDSEPANEILGAPTKLLVRLLPIYFKTRDEDLRTIDRALDARDFVALKGLGHKIKGGAATYGFMGVSELSGQLEAAAEAEKFEVCQALIVRIKEGLAEDRIRPRATSPDANA